MTPTTRREFTREALASLTTLALVEGLIARRLVGAAYADEIGKWLGELNQISHDLQDQKLRDLQFQTSLENLYRKVDLQAFLASLDLEAVEKSARYPAKGAASLPVEFKKVSGIPTDLVFGRQIFAMKQGRSIVPHGHDNMATGFLVLKGTCRGRHWDRVEDHKDHYILRPTIDGSFGPGTTTTISDHKDNVHWFTAESEVAFVFNIHVMDYNRDNPKKSGRVYVDPLGEKLADGLIKAPRISYGEVNRRYG